MASLNSFGRSLLVPTLLTTILIISTAAWASGPSGSGGGNAVGSILFDFYENQGTQEFNVMQTEAYEQTLAPIHAELAKRLPGFATALRSGLKSKKWFLETKPLNDQNCLNPGSLIAVNQIVVACQDEGEIRVSKVWFQGADQKNQAALINHELLINQVLLLAQNTNHKADLEKYARQLNRIIFSGSLPAEDELQNQVSKLGFGDYRTASQLEALNAQVNKLRTEITKSVCDNAGGYNIGTLTYAMIKIDEISSSVWRRSAERQSLNKFRDNLDKIQKQMIKAHFNGQGDGYIGCSELKKIPVGIFN